MKRGLLLAAVATALFTSSGAGQSFVSDDAVLRRIWTLGMDSSRTRPLAQALMDSIGPRLTSSPQHRAGNDWLIKQYRSWGIDARNHPYGTWRNWQRGITHGIAGGFGGAGGLAAERTRQVRRGLVRAAVLPA